MRKAIWPAVTLLAALVGFALGRTGSKPIAPPSPAPIQREPEKLAGNPSPELMLAEFDNQGKTPVDPQLIEQYDSFLALASAVFTNPRREIAYKIMGTTSKLNAEGRTTDAYSVLRDSVGAMIAEKDRMGSKFEKRDYAKFIGKYEFFRREGSPHDLSIQDATEAVNRKK